MPPQMGALQPHGTVRDRHTARHRTPDRLIKVNDGPGHQPGIVRHKEIHCPCGLGRINQTAEGQGSRCLRLPIRVLGGL